MSQTRPEILPGLRRRIRDAIGDRTLREVAATVGMNRETVRRYMSGATPSLEFCARLAEALDLDLHALVLNTRYRERPASDESFGDADQITLSDASTRELCAELAERLASQGGHGETPTDASRNLRVIN